VDKGNLTQFGRAMKHLGIEMIAAYSPEARGRCERMFSTHQERIPMELAAAGISDMDAANAYLKDKYIPAFNEEFSVKPTIEATAFVQWFGGSLDDIPCEQHERTVNKDNTVSFEGRILQIPSDEYRHHYVKSRVRVHRYGGCPGFCVNGQTDGAFRHTQRREHDRFKATQRPHRQGYVELQEPRRPAWRERDSEATDQGIGRASARS